MKRQERETMRRNEYSGTHLYTGWQAMGRRFIYVGKDNLLFQPPARSGRGFEELEVQNFLKSMASSRRNQDLPDAPIIKPISIVICPK
jgi:hypothetical protein